MLQFNQIDSHVTDHTMSDDNLVDLVAYTSEIYVFTVLFADFIWVLIDFLDYLIEHQSLCKLIQ